MSELDLATKLNIVTDYYGAGTIWDRMSIDGLSAEQINAMYNSLPASSFTVDRTPSGLNLGRNYSNPFELPVTPGTDFDSNIPGGSYGGGNTFTGNVPANLEVDPSTGLPVRQTAGPTTSGGSVLPAIADRVALAVTGVNIGAKLGLAIDRALYNLNPSWWDANLPTVNPETWNSLVGVNPVGDFFLRVLFGITGNNMTGYISDDMLAYYYMLLRDKGIWQDGGYGTVTPAPGVTSNLVNDWTNYSANLSLTQGDISWVNFTRQYIYVVRINSGYGLWYGGPTSYSIAVVSDSNVAQMIVFETYYINQQTGVPELVDRTYPPTRAATYNNKTYYYSDLAQGATIDRIESGPTNNTPSGGVSTLWDIAEIIYTGQIDFPTGQDGINPMQDATQYPPTNITGSTPQEVKQQLQQEYPDLFTDAVTERTLQDDGTVTETTYVPIPWVTEGLNPEQPTTGDGKGQTDTEVDPTTGEQVLPTTQQDEPTQPPDTGEGTTPTPAVPTGSASSLWAVYNPSQGELNSFGAWLWNSNFVEQLKKLFADPMQAIIGVHKVFATPSTGGSQTIKCGYLDSGVSASVVTNQYTTIDCGSASLREYFGNVFDYDPFTKVSIFLPFIGVVPLNTADVMRSTISVKYKVDVITGACLAEVSVSRDGGGGILYTYGGSAIVTYPVSSGSYIGAVQAALSTAIGIGSAIATGGASLGASAGMVLGGLSHAKTQVQHSGQFSGCSGAMGGKKPYLIISRPQTRTPQRIAEYEGIPTNSIHQLINCNGFTKVKEVHVVSKTAYDNELQEIESLLKTGVIF